MAGKLKARLAEELPRQRKVIKDLAKNHGDKVIGEYTVGQVLGGMRGIRAVLCDTSTVDPEKGLIVRGRPILDLVDKLPEEIFYLLIAGELPTRDQLVDLQDDLRKRAEVPDYVWKVIRAMPADSHPMTMLDMAILSMQHESKAARDYEKTGKDDLWELFFEDGLRLIATVHTMAAGIYRIRYGKGDPIKPTGEDWGAEYAHMHGLADSKGDFAKLMRLYLTLHCDHESGNVSTNTALTVGSAHSDPFYAISAGLNGLAGPLHGLANQRTLQWILGLIDKFKGVPSKEQVATFAWETLNGGQTIPGYGHAVLRYTDPRFTALRDFGKKHLPEDPVFRTVDVLFQVLPDVLRKHGKAANPWPNVDAGSGALIYHYGMTEFDYYTVLFGVSRTLGFVSQLVYNRGISAAIARPKSISSEWIKALINK